MHLIGTLATALDLMGAAGLLVALGWKLAGWQLQAQRHAARTERTALEQTRRVRETFLWARRAMRAESDRQAGDEHP